LRTERGLALGIALVVAMAGTISRTEFGWSVDTLHLARRPRGEPPSPDAAIDVARQVADRLGIPAEHLTAVHHDASASQTVTIDRLVGGRDVPVLQWTVVFGPGGAINGVEGYVVDVESVGRVPLEPAESVAQRLGSARATAPVDHLALWAVTVGTNMMGYARLRQQREVRAGRTLAHRHVEAAHARRGHRESRTLRAARPGVRVHVPLGTGAARTA
jgi:hypothetical protein